MSTLPSQLLPVRDTVALLQWYAIYTRPRHEKWVAQQCHQRGLESFLPLYTVTRFWKNRRAEVQLPLFATYVFVRMSLLDRLKVLSIPSTVSLVSFQGAPAPIPEEQINSLTRAVARRRVEPHEYLAVGQRVRVRNGPFSGLEGIVERHKGRVNVVVSIEWIHRSVSVQLMPTDLEWIDACRGTMATLKLSR